MHFHNFYNFSFFSFYKDVNLRVNETSSSILKVFLLLLEILKLVMGIKDHCRISRISWTRTDVLPFKNGKE